MTRHRIPIVAVLSLVVGAALPRPAPAAAPSISLPDAPVKLRYAMRVLGAAVGRPEVDLGPIESLASGAKVRWMKVKGGTLGALRHLYPFDNTIVSVIDTVTYRPLRSKIKTIRAEKVQTYDFRFGDKVFKATLGKNGKVKEVEEPVAEGTIDVPTSLVWLQARGIAPGQTHSVPVHSGNHGYRLLMTAKKWDTVIVPAGSYKALAVECVLFKTQEAEVAGKEPIAEWRLWLHDDAYRTVVRLDAQVGVVGEVVFELEGMRIREATKGG